MPPLEQVMGLVKGRCMVNLDKAYDYSEQVHRLLLRTGTLDHAIFKGSAPPVVVLVWVNTLWDGHLAGGHADERAAQNPDAV